MSDYITTQDINKAIEQLNRLYGELSEENKIALDVLIEKQISKKPSYIYNEFDKSSKRWRCPNCTALLYEIDTNNCGWGHQADYCEDCGQAIDWGEE